MPLGDDLTRQQRNLILGMVEADRALPPDKQGGDFVTPASRHSSFLVKYAGRRFDATEGTLEALKQFEYIVSKYQPVPMPGVNAGRYVGQLTAKAFSLYDQSQTLTEQPETPIQETAEQSRVDPEPLSPHDETILFELIEFDRNLPREEQSHRFDVSVFVSEEEKAPRSEIRGANTNKKISRNAGVETFEALRDAGYTEGGKRPGSVLLGDKWVRHSLSQVKLTAKAFPYYAEKHDFPSSLADERRALVDSVVSTEYPKVVSHLKQAYEEIWLDQPEDNWSAVAHRCDDALEAFAEMVWQPKYADELNEKQPPRDKYVRRLQQVIRRNADDEELRGLLVKLQDYIAARRHDAQTTQAEAKRLVLMTYLVIGDVYELLNPTQGINQ